MMYKQSMRIFQLYLLLLIFGCISVSQNVYAGETVFFESLYDVPIMEGLTEVKDLSLSFDKAEGRIAYSTARSEKLSSAEILAFYDATLPQMGWEKKAPNMFKREQEILEISVEKSKTSEYVRFLLQPISK